MGEIQPLIFVVSDFGAGDLAFAEIKRQLKSRIREADIDYVSVPSYSTIATGFCIYQIALDGGSKETEKGNYIFSNTAPRRDNPNPRKQNEGEGLVYARLKTGLEIVAVFSSYTFSFVKPIIEELRFVNVENTGSQFRSRDKYPEPFSRIIKGDYSVLGKTLNPDIIPEPPKDKIAYVDGYGNIKLTTHTSQAKLKHGDRVRVEINKKILYGVYTDGMFNILEGQLSVSPGSSGPEKDRFLQISIRLGNAWENFGKPRVEENVLISRVNTI